jgi:hypothetical protein
MNLYVTGGYIAISQKKAGELRGFNRLKLEFHQENI